MKLNYRINKKIILLAAGDLFIFYGALFFTLAMRYGTHAAPLERAHLFPFTIIFAVWILLFGASGFYDLRFSKNGKLFLYRLLRAMAVNTAIAIIIFYLFHFAIEPRRNLFLITGLATLTIFLWRYLFNILLIKTSLSRIVFFGATPEAIHLAEFLLAHPQFGHMPVAFISHGELPFVTPPSSLPHLTTTNEHLARTIQSLRAETVVILPEMKRNPFVVKTLFQLVPSGVAVVEFPAFHEMLTGKIPLSLVEEVWFLENLIGIKKRSYEFLKRLLDLIIACACGACAALIFPFIALAIKIDSEGPILFYQRRVGRHGKIFNLLKYRSMVLDADKMGGFKGEGVDPRHTHVGAFLRKSYLDEIPQIWNIVKGEMSFVGPRPERPEYVADLEEKIPFYETRLLVQPGITGWAQVNMENDASVEDAPEKMQYDLYYIKNRSFILDLLIILKTLFTLIRRRGR